MPEMKRYRKKPVVIEAFLFDGTRDSIPRIESTGESYFDPDAGVLVIHTLEGVMHASPGDYVIQGVAGELYSCKADIFHATYDPVEE